MKKTKTEKKEKARGTRLLNGKFWVDPMSGPIGATKDL